MNGRLRPGFLYLVLLVLSLLLLGLQSSHSQHSALREARKNRFVTGQTRQRSRRYKDPSDLLSNFREAAEFLKARFKQNGHRVHLYGKGQPSRGIVICAGGRRLLVNAFVTIKIIRRHFKSQLPVELYYYGEAEVDTTVLQAIEELGVRAIDISILPRPDLAEWPEELHGYAKKVYSLYSTGFREVLMIDADNQLLSNPDRLFDMHEFQAHGAVFWPDYWTAYASLEAPKDGLYKLLGLPLPWADKPQWASTESGQMLFNRELHSVALGWILWLNLWDKVTYQYVLGDKDTFEIGFMLSGSHDKFAKIPTPPRAAFTSVEKGLMKHVGIVQSVKGMPTFLHRTTGGKFDDKKTVDEQLRPFYITEPMSVPRAKKYIWHVTWAINTLRQEVTIFQPDCESIHNVTKTALCNIGTDRTVATNPNFQSLAKRYCECGASGDTPSEFVPVLPMDVYGKPVVEAVEYGYAAFDDIVTILNRHEQ